MKQKNLFKIAMLFAFAMITNFSYGQTTASYNFSTEVTGLNEASPGITVDANIGFGSFKNSASTNPGIYSDQLRLYQNATKGGSIIIYALNGATITDVVVNASDRTGPAGYTVDGGSATNLAGGSTYTISGINATSEVEFFQKDANSSNRIYVDSFDVTYTMAGTPGITLGEVTNHTDETGATATFTVVLNAEPTTDVVLNVSSGDTDEVNLDTATLTFSNGDWDTPQTVTATGVDDGVIDGDTDVTVTVAVDDALSDDAYDGLSDTLTITNDDDELAPSIGFDTATSDVDETNATFNVSIPVTVANYSGEQIDISIAASGTADGTDYTLNTASLSFSADGSQNISLDINDDEDTDDETIILTITETSSVTGLVISQAMHTVTITDDEEPVIPSLIITEVSDPSDIYQGRFIEIYNNGITDIDLTTEQINIVFQSNGGNISSRALSGTLDANTVMVIGNSSNINSNYGFDADENYGTINGNGDDGYYLYYGGDNTSGTLLDSYGVLGEDGTNKEWEYEDSRAIRLNPKTATPNATWTTAEWSITSANIVDMTPGALENEYRYDGDWKPRDVYANATAADDVYISSDVTLSSNLSIKNFEVTTGNVATIANGTSLLVSGTSTGNVTYNRTLTYDADKTKAWYLVSSPVNGEIMTDMISNNTLATSGANIGFAPYDNSQADSNDRWSYFGSGATDALVNGKGYTAKLGAAGDLSFTGTLNTGDVAIGLTQGSNNFNLIGNPYASYINSGTFLTTNTDELVQEEIYIWNQGTGQYDTQISGDSFKVAPGQGFFVEANTTNDVTFTTALQSNEASDTFQKSTARPEVQLFMNNGDASRYLKVYYIDGTTTGFDNGYDGKLFGGVPQPFALYSHLVSDSKGENFQIQSLPNSDLESMVIPVGIIADAGKEITFTAQALNLPSELKVFLEDREANSYTRLDEANANYKVTLDEALNGVGRFFLHTSANKSTLDIDAVALDNISIYNTNNSNLRIVGLSQGKANIKLFNILGKQVLNTTFTSNGVQDISLPNLATGIYIVQLETEAGKLNKKITLE